MARKRLFLTDEFPYHVTNRANNKENFAIPLQELWWIICDVLRVIRNEYQAEFLQLVLMSNHYHLMLLTPQKNLSECMLYFHREVAKRSNRSAERMNHFFGGRYKWCLLLNENYFWNTVKYIYRNPVEAGLCQKVEDYPYSSILKNPDRLFEPKDFPWNLQSFRGLDFNWLNHDFQPEQKVAIQQALRKRVFEVGKNKNRQSTALASRPIILANNMPPPQKVLGTF